MKLIVYGGDEKVLRRGEPEESYGYSAHGLDFALHLKGIGVLEFDSPEEAERIAGIILVGLQKNGLPKRRGDS